VLKYNEKLIYLFNRNIFSMLLTTDVKNIFSRTLHLQTYRNRNNFTEKQ